MDFFIRYDRWSEPDPVSLPPSKSLQARVLVIAALSGRKARIPVAGRSDDVATLADALKKIGKTSRIDVGASGTAMRLLTAYAAILPGVETIIGGSSRLNERPMKDLVDALRTLGADICYEGEEGYPPLIIKGRNLDGGYVEMPGAISSQFVSALLIIAPLMRNGLKLRLTGRHLPSSSYVAMTRQVMERFGIKSVSHRNREIEVRPGDYVFPATTPAEDDWSAAAFFYEFAALSGKNVIIRYPGDPAVSLQGDSAVASLFRYFGVDTEVLHDGAVRICPTGENVRNLDINMLGQLDLVPAVAVTSALMEIPFRISGVKNLRLKESNRIMALCNELGKLGYIIRESDNEIEWNGKKTAIGECPVISTYSDHRIAMAFAMAAVKIPSLIVSDINTVKKSFPKFWHQASRVGIKYSPSTLADRL